MCALVTRLRQAEDREAGLSLTELIVTMMVTSVLLVIVGSMFINVVKVTSTSNTTTTRTSNAANILNEISTVIRPATTNAVAGSSTPEPAIVAGTPSSVTLYSLVDTSAVSPKPSKVSFSVDASGNLIESRWAATDSAGVWVFTGSPVTRKLPGPLRSLTGSSALFVYYDSAGAEIVPGGSGLTLAQRTSVASVQVTVSIANTTTTGDDPITLINTIVMPNVVDTGAGA